MLARPVVAGRTYLLSRRVTQRTFLLRPEAAIIAIYQYLLALAAYRYGIVIHGWITMSNHHHVVFTDVEGNFPEFLTYLHAFMAKCVNRLRGRRENLWATEQPNVVWLVDPEDRFRKLVYLLANPVADGLVDRISDWPGASSLGASLHGTVLRMRRPRGFFRKEGKLPEYIELKAEPLPGYEHLSPKEWTTKLGDTLREVEDSARAARLAAKRRVLGRAAVLEMDPFGSPSTPEARGGLRPFIACANRERRKIELDALDAFHAAYVIAREAWRKRVAGTLFPFATYKMLRLGASAHAAPASV
jgi:hypothetical protein